jgi:hypothetical protein
VAWIRDVLRPHGPSSESGVAVSVGALLPATYDRYLRLFHRFTDGEGHSRRWSERAKAAGVFYHSQLSLRALGRVTKGSFSEDAWDPSMGVLDDVSGVALSNVLNDRASGSLVSLYFGISVQVYGQEERVIERPVMEMTKAHTFPHPMFDQMEIEGPQLVWPKDHTWIVCIDYDLTSTYIACDDRLAEQLESVPELEILRTTLDDRVDYRMDTINCGPTGLSVGPPLG